MEKYSHLHICTDNNTAIRTLSSIYTTFRVVKAKRQTLTNIEHRSWECETPCSISSKLWPTTRNGQLIVLPRIVTSCSVSSIGFSNKGDPELHNCDAMFRYGLNFKDMHRNSWSWLYHLTKMLSFVWQWVYESVIHFVSQKVMWKIIK